MDAIDLEHLSPDFDPQSVTIPRLRAILLAHDVDYPATAKKQQLVDIFSEHVAPQANRILTSRARTKPSAKGITDAPSTGASSVVDDDDGGFVAESVEHTGRRTSRRSTPRASGGRTSIAPSSRASTVDRKRSSFSEASEQDNTERRRRRSRKSGNVMPIKEEPSDAMEDDSPFSPDNPFQRGASADIDVTSRRRSELGLGKTPSKAPRTSAHKKRLSDVIAQTGSPNVQRAGSTPAKDITEDEEDFSDEDDYSSDGGEEFTPEEQHQLELEEEADQTLVRRRKRGAAHRSNGTLKSAPWAILLALLGGFATVWRQEKLNVGYCGIGRPSTAIGGVQIPEWAQFLRPTCEPCPQHAYCSSALQTTCEPDFVLKPHPLSAAGLVPLLPTCEPDGEKARKVKAVADRAVGELRERNAQWECGKLRDEHGSKSKGPEIAEQELKAIVGSKRRRGMSQEEFEELWTSAIGEVAGREEVTADVDGWGVDELADRDSDVENGTDQICCGWCRHSGRRRLRSSSLAKLGLGCAVRRSVRLAVARHLWKLVGVILGGCVVLYARRFLSTRKSSEEQARRLASVAMEQLAIQATAHKKDARQTPEGWISMAQLRDDVLRNEFSSRKRMKLWQRVQAKVEGNSNVRTAVRQLNTGEVSRVWEWIGAARALESDSRDGGRYGGDKGHGSQSQSQGVGDGQRGRQGSTSSLSSLRRWADSRPIY